MASDCGVEKHSIGSAEGWELMFRQGMERKPAVAVVFRHIGPYHHARLNVAAEKLTVTESSGRLRRITHGGQQTRLTVEHRCPKSGARK